jgi:hypothetical protein
VIELPTFDELRSPDSEEFISPKFTRGEALSQSKSRRKRARKIVESDSETDYQQKEQSKPEEPSNYEVVEVSEDDGSDNAPRTKKRAIQVMDADQMRKWMTQMREEAAQQGQGPQSSKDSPRLRRKVAAQRRAASVGSRRSTARSMSIASTRISVKQELDDIVKTAKRTARMF